jgi:hypothetical protein
MNLLRGIMSYTLGMQHRRQLRGPGASLKENSSGSCADSGARTDKYTD